MSEWEFHDVNLFLRQPLIPSVVSTNSSDVSIAQINESPDEYVVVGGHLDSTIGNTSENSTSPGADDDASGIATLTEVMRVFVSEGVQLKRSVKFYAYAAEEVGLRGAKEIANNDAANGVNIVGALQLDMTGYAGSSDDITLITDYTSSSQNAFLTNLMNTYMPDVKHFGALVGITSALIGFKIKSLVTPATTAKSALNT
jgi:Zn-dependent M28 family amino/carboxypeptidase